MFVCVCVAVCLCVSAPLRGCVLALVILWFSRCSISFDLSPRALAHSASPPLGFIVHVSRVCALIFLPPPPRSGVHAARSRVFLEWATDTSEEPLNGL